MRRNWTYAAGFRQPYRTGGAEPYIVVWTMTERNNAGMEPWETSELPKGIVLWTKGCERAFAKVFLHKLSTTYQASLRCQVGGRFFVDLLSIPQCSVQHRMSARVWMLRIA